MKWVLFIFLFLMFSLIGCAPDKDKIFFEKLENDFAKRELKNVASRRGYHRKLLFDAQYMHRWYPESKYLKRADEIIEIVIKELGETNKMLDAIHEDKVRKYQADKEGHFAHLEKISKLDRLVTSDEGHGDCTYFKDYLINREVSLRKNPSLDSPIVSKIPKGTVWDDITCKKELLRFGHGEYDRLPVLFWYHFVGNDPMGNLYYSFDGIKTSEAHGMWDPKFKVLKYSKNRWWIFFKFPGNIEGWAVDAYDALNTKESPPKHM